MGRLPPHTESHPEDAPPQDPQPVPGQGQGQDPLRGNRSRDQPRPQHRPDAACQIGTEHIREGRIGTSWIVEVAATGRRDGKLFQARYTSKQVAHHPRSPAATGSRSEVVSRKLL